MKSNKEVIFESLSFGSLILAKREKNTKNIDKGHRNGPFLVIGRKNKYLICLYATSKNTNSIIKISKNNYNLNKDTYITSKTKLISINEFLTSIYYLNEKEKKNLIKFLYINGINKYDFLDEPNIETGDIIKLENYHLIIGEKNNNYITIKVEFDETDILYKFDYKNKKLLPKNLQYKRVAFLSDEELSKCICEVKKYGKLNTKIDEKIISPLKVGNLIIYKNLLYYLYYELGDKKLSFAVSKNQTPVSKKIIINGEVYHANFGLKRDFDENQENVLLVAEATEEEKKLIKEIKNRRSK